MSSTLTTFPASSLCRSPKRTRPIALGSLTPRRLRASQRMQTYDHGTFLIVLDCADLDRSANFWCPALGYDRPYPQSGPYLQLVAEARGGVRSEEHTSELQSRQYLVCRLLLEKKKTNIY